MNKDQLKSTGNSIVAIENQIYTYKSWFPRSLTVEESYKNKIGITLALPFKGEFTCKGYNSVGFQFSEYAEDNLQLFIIPLRLKFTYNY